VHNASAADSGGGVVTVYGAHFGVAGASVRVGDTVCEDVSYVEEHAALRCRVGSATGAVQARYGVVVSLSGQSSGGAVVYAYGAPVVESCSRVGTEGGDVTVRGRSFGEAGAVVSVAGRVCVGVRYESRHRVVVCRAGGGVGGAHNVSVESGGRVGVGVGVFSYAEPQVHNVSAVSTAGGRVTVGGAGFGTAAGDVRVWLGEGGGRRVHGCCCDCESQLCVVCCWCGQRRAAECASGCAGTVWKDWWCIQLCCSGCAQCEPREQCWRCFERAGQQLGTAY